MDGLFNSLVEIFPIAGKLGSVGSLVALALVAICLDFIFRFVLPSLRLGTQLKGALAAHKRYLNANPGSVVGLDAFGEALATSPQMQILWQEYKKTLHPDRKVDEFGSSKVARWRSTTLADSFFTEQALVDTPLRTEFYKHLPGILTGIGIIGTFFGLIFGLQEFRVAQNPAEAQEQLQRLINTVGHAFWVSAAAILLAMLFTWVEKQVVSSLYRMVEDLRQRIDSSFDSGAGEEYLERLMVASETQATQAIQIKDALVADLKEILTSLTAQQLEAQARATEIQVDSHRKSVEEQLEAQARNTGQLSVEIGKAISDHLGQPLADISKAVSNITAQQGDAVNRMLTDVLKRFSEDMQQMFGGQLQGMTDLLKEASESMRLTADKFGQLATDMDTAGKGTVDAMGDRLKEVIASMESRQQVMNEQMRQFVEQIRTLVTQSQSESSSKLQETLSAVNGQVTEAVAELRKQAERAAFSQGARQERFESSTQAAITTLSSEMEKLLAQSVDTNRALQDTVQKLSASTTAAISGLNDGAQTLYIAATDFAKAGQGVSETLKASGSVANEIKNAAGNLALATGAAKEVLSDYARTRDTFATMVADLRATVENARREASLTEDFIKRMEGASEQMAVAQTTAEAYLKSINTVLEGVHKSFADQISETLRKGNTAFLDEMRTAVQLVSGSIRQLGDVVGSIPSGRD